MKKKDTLIENNFTDEHYRDIVEKVVQNSNVPSETNKNHILVGRSGLVNDYSYSFYNPHNARFYFKFNKWNFKPDMNFKKSNSTELSIDFMNCRLVVKKSFIEITNKIDSERRFVVDGSEGNREEATKKAIAILEIECINILKEFIKCYGGASDFICVKRHIADNKILHDRIIDSLPKEMTWNDDVSKKVYKEIPLNVEYKSPVYAANAFRNLGLKEFSPEIVKELEDIKSERLEFNKSLALYTEQINLHLKVEQRQLEVQEAMLNHFKVEDRRDKIKRFIDEYK